MIAITLDLEWAPRPVLADCLDLLDEYDIDATLFSTHNDSLSCPHHERGIHPNFSTNESAASILDELNSLYPNAIGLRSHQMFISTKLRDKYVEYGIEYESNYMAYKVKHLHPFRMPEGTVQFPVYWMDDIWFRHDDSEPDLPELLSSDGLKVFDFHPPHITFNTPTEEYYSEHKDLYWDENPDISDLRYSGYGVRDMFLDILSFIEKRELETYTLGEIYRDYQGAD